MWGFSLGRQTDGERERERSKRAPLLLYFSTAAVSSAIRQRASERTGQQAGRQEEERGREGDDARRHVGVWVHFEQRKK